MRHVLGRSVLLALAASATLQCRPGILYDGAPTDECFCGTFSTPRDGGSIEITLGRAEGGTLVFAIAEPRDLPGHPWSAVQFLGEITRPGTARGEATVFFDSETPGEYFQTRVPLQLALLPTTGTCAERSTLQLELSYLDAWGDRREESYSLESTALCPDDG